MDAPPDIDERPENLNPWRINFYPNFQSISELDKWLHLPEVQVQDIDENAWPKL